MIKIKAKNISGTIIQIGKNNTVSDRRFIDKHEEELLRLINEYTPTDEQKQELIADLSSIKNEDENQPRSARQLLSFFKSIGKDVVSGVIVSGLEHLANN